MNATTHKIQPAKAEQLDIIKKQFDAKRNIIFTQYSGLTVEEISDLRKQLRDIGAEYHVFKNTLMNIALKELNIDIDEKILTGPTAVCISGGKDIVAQCKIIYNYTKKNEKVNFKGAYLDNVLYNENQFQQLAQLPSREQLIARIIGGVKQPITRIHSLVTGPLRKVVYAVKAVADKKQ